MLLTDTYDDLLIDLLEDGRRLSGCLSAGLLGPTSRLGLTSGVAATAATWRQPLLPLLRRLLQSVVIVLGSSCEKY